MNSLPLLASTSSFTRRGVALDPHPLDRPATRLAVDLHLHSPHAGGVSHAMTLKNIIVEAQRKGLDMLGTGDCLQPDRLREIDTTLLETGTGFLVPRPEIEDACRQLLPPRLHRPLRFVLSTEVCCAPSARTKYDGLHHLIYFRSPASAHRFRERIAPYGDLSEGRPTLRLTSRELLILVVEHGDGCELAPAHILSPWYSTLGSKNGQATPRAVFGDLTALLLGVEMGPTATLPMCRRISALDTHAVFCCSDAHSLPHLGREYTVLDAAPNYDALMTALRDPTGRSVRGFVKFPIQFAGSYYNFCRHCEQAFDRTVCPCCGATLALGSRDRLEAIADRHNPLLPATTPPSMQLLPLADLIAVLTGTDVNSKSVTSLYTSLIGALGDERHILTEATTDEIGDVLATSRLARAIVAQRSQSLQFSDPQPASSLGLQSSWTF